MLVAGSVEWSNGENLQLYHFAIGIKRLKNPSCNCLLSCLQIIQALN